MIGSNETIAYKRSRFSTRLPRFYRFTQAHFWIAGEDNGILRVGLTKFATRMLGDLVETGLEVKIGHPIRIGDVIGFIECLKAASDLYAVVEGEVTAFNEALNESPEWLVKDGYGKGWLYEVRGVGEPKALDAEGYAAFLDETIDRMMGEGYGEP